MKYKWKTEIVKTHFYVWKTHSYGDSVCLLKLPHLLIWSCAAKSASSAARRRSRSSSSCSSKYFISCFVLLCKCSVSDNLLENNKAYAKKGLIHGLLWFYCTHWCSVWTHSNYFPAHTGDLVIFTIFKLFGKHEKINLLKFLFHIRKEFLGSVNMAPCSENYIEMVWGIMC